MMNCAAPPAPSHAGGDGRRRAARTILSGGFVSGERLVETKIARAHDVSQNTVRDALRILEQEELGSQNPARRVRADAQHRRRGRRLAR
ncbi:MAG: GntR family transcriptional regulator [Anaerolineae bacterium]